MNVDANDVDDVVVVVVILILPAGALPALAWPTPRIVPPGSLQEADRMHQSGR